jgi:hypothetical protein
MTTVLRTSGNSNAWRRNFRFRLPRDISPTYKSSPLTPYVRTYDGVAYTQFIGISRSLLPAITRMSVRLLKK